MEAADSMRTPRVRNASFDHAFVVAVLAHSAMLSISAFRAKFGLRVIWLSAVRVPGSGRPPGAFRELAYNAPPISVLSTPLS
jgi:hypothetical protein